MVYAIVRAGGHQEKVSVGDLITVDRLQVAPGSLHRASSFAVGSWREGYFRGTDLAKVTVTAEVVENLQRREDRNPEVQEQDRLQEAPGLPCRSDQGQGHLDRLIGPIVISIFVAKEAKRHGT